MVLKLYLKKKWRILKMTDNLDTRDLQERLDELEDLAESNEIDKYDIEELFELLELKDELGGYGWEYGINMIHENNFDDYAEELFDECYAHDVPDNLKNYIDYEAFAEDLQMDYSEVEYQGETYYWREA